MAPVFPTPTTGASIVGMCCKLLTSTDELETDPMAFGGVHLDGAHGKRVDVEGSL